MKTRERFTSLFTIFVLLLAAVGFNGCERDGGIVSSDISGTNAPAGRKTLNFLKLKSAPHALNKQISTSQWVTATGGGLLELQHGSSQSAAGLIYGVSYSAPYRIYQIDPQNPSAPLEVGSLLFKTKAIAVHPQSGKVYYVSSNNINGLYPFAVWDPVTNTNTLLLSLNTTRPCDKLAFDLNGNLYAVDRDNKTRLHKIDPQTGAWLSYQDFNDHFSAYGDFAFGADGKFYNVNGYNSKFQVADFATNTLTTINYTNIDDLSGIACGSNGTLYLCRNNGDLYSIDPVNAQTTYLGNTGITGLEDLGSGHFEKELSYASVSLNILPGAVNADLEIEMSMETTELAGGVAMTFSPHGTVFNTPALLNLTAHGVDFTGVDPATVDIYYDNQETGVWEPMQKDQLIVDVTAGTIQVINGRLPHFSRYAISAD